MLQEMEAQLKRELKEKSDEISRLRAELSKSKASSKEASYINVRWAAGTLHAWLEECMMYVHA